MKNKKLLALLLAVVLLLTQFSMLGVNAATTALTGRTDFLMGVAIHRPNGYETYKEPYKAILDAKALGSSLIRTDAESDDFDADFAYIADKNDMDVMFVTSIDLTLSGKTSLTQEEYDKVYNKFYNKATALKDYDAYIQIDNELDNIYYKGSGLLTDGTDASRYNSVVGVALAINAANKAVKDANAANGSNIKTIVNFSYNHYGFFKALKNVKIDASNVLTTTASSNYLTADWDIIGWDYYSNMADDASYSSILSGLESNFDKKIIVCESNLTPTGKNSDGSISYAKDVAWLETFVNACYQNNNVIGFVAYELYDQSKLEGSTFNKEAHFGLIDKDGNKKDTYNTLCTLYGGTGVVADRTIPANPELDFADIEISKEGVSTTWPSSYSKTRDRLVINLTESPIDLSEVSYFEFDLYIEDYESFKASVEGKRINFVLASSDSKTKTCVRFDIEDQITKSGWNHISLKPEDRWNVDSQLTYKTIKWAMINFQDGANEANPIAGQKVALVNVCGLKDEIDRTPAWPEYEHIKASEGKKDYWSRYSNTGNNFEFSFPEPVDIKIADSGEIRYYDQVEFDIYIKDYDVFKAAAEGHELHFRIGYQASSGEWQYADMDIQSKITHSGWNHVSAIWTVAANADYNSNDFTDRHNGDGGKSFNPAKNKVSYVKMYWNSNTSATVNEEFRNTQVRITNICFSKAEANRIPEWPEYEHVKAYKTFNKNFWGGDKSASKNFIVTGLSPINMAETHQVEFDLFVNDRDSYLNGLSGKDIFFRFGDSNDSYIDVKIDKNQITKSGWNHIVLVWVDSSVDSNTNRHSITYSSNTPGKIDLEKITWVKFYCNDSVHWETTRRTRMSNICFTKKEIDRIPAWPEYDHIELLKNTDANYWGSTPGNSNFYVDSLGPINIENTDQVEFDIFVENYDSYKSGLSGKDIFLRLGSAGSNYVDVKIDKDQITKSGWNHIKLVWVTSDINPDSDRHSVTGTVDFKNITWLKFHCTSSVDWQITKKTRMANICFTSSEYEPELEVPTEVMKDKMDFIGNTIKNVTFDAEGYSIIYGLNETIDISGDNMMLELDVYIKNDDVSTLTVEVLDSNDCYAAYEFGGLTNGWNRLAIRVSDYIDADDIDFSDITTFDFVGEPKAEVAVANFYAASYVEGDANRDGIMNLIDLIHMKKYTANIPSTSGIVGNIVAMDLSGNDYIIDSTDLSALKISILNAQ